jgi:hypothetical protein
MKEGNVVEETRSQVHVWDDSGKMVREAYTACYSVKGGHNANFLAAVLYSNHQCWLSSLIACYTRSGWCLVMAGRVCLPCGVTAGLRQID